MSNQNSNFTNFLNSALNENQLRAVTPATGVLLVRAGAGSGKTRVITARMANLILNHHVHANSIIALTFTNKAAKEMKERVAHFLNNNDAPYVGTFHSYCYRLLKLNAHLLPFQPFTLLDDSDQEKIVKKLINRYGLSKQVTARNVLSFISKIKNDTLSDAARESMWEQNKIYKDLYYLYETEKRAAHCYDFDDLLLETLKLFENNSEFKVKFQERIKHILIDEYQDTNKVQHALLKAISLNNQGKFILDSLCVVGDEDQSIYSWRGATVSNIINFSREFSNTDIITIDQNYRSVQPILEAANLVIQNNIGRNPKNLWSDKSAQDRIRLLTYGSSYQEAAGIAQFIKCSSKNNSLSSHAILYRSHYQSRSLEEALIRQSIPYKILGGIQFYDRLEIKDLLAYARLVINPFDRMALSRVINTPSRGLGDKFEELFFNTWLNQPFMNFKDVANYLLENSLLTKSKQESLIAFLNIFDGIDAQNKPSEVIQEFLKRAEYLTYLKENFEKEEYSVKKENIKELINSAMHFETISENPTLDGFLESVSLLQEQINKTEDEKDYVVLMTLHAAKGLEFDTVLLPGLEEAVLPSSHAMFNSETLEEERRLLYVGITRARERLLISNCKYRNTYGTMTDQRPSRFLSEFSNELISKIDCSHWQDHHFTNYFNNWLADKPQENREKAIAKNLEQKSEHKLTSAASKLAGAKAHAQKITHEKFGIGTVQKIEQKGDKSIFTIQFNSGIKKIDGAYLQAA